KGTTMQRFVPLCFLTMVFGVPASADDKDPTRNLDMFVGAWNVVLKYKMPDGKEHEGKSSCVAKLVINHRFLQQEYQRTMMNQPLVIWQLIGYDSAKKKFVEHYLNAHGENSHTMQTEGDFSNEGKVLTLRGDSIDATTGKLAKVRFVTTV